MAGQFYSAPVTALGGTPPYTAWTATGLPAGLSISRSTGLISGTPLAAGTFAVGVSVTDSASKTGNRSYTLRIANPLAITTTSLPYGIVGSGYSQMLASTGGTAPVSWTIASGSSLPPGLMLSGALISGTPTTPGSYSFTVQATDSTNPVQVVSQPLTIAVAGNGDIVTNGSFEDPVITPGTFSICASIPGWTATTPAPAGSRFRTTSPGRRPSETEFSSWSSTPTARARFSRP